jgi:DNA-binding LacI/PurR family transcriptional regulator
MDCLFFRVPDWKPDPKLFFLIRNSFQSDKYKIFNFICRFWKSAKFISSKIWEVAKKIKNKDLALRLGLSGTLVSLVLNNKADQQGIRKETQERVLLLARQMGYFDSLNEKNEVSPAEVKPGIIGMIVPSVNNPFVVEISPFLHKAFSSIGIGFSLLTRDPDDQRFDRMIGAFKKFYSGLILFGEAADENTIRALKATDYPFVLLEKNVKSLRLNNVCTDTYAGAVMVSNHIEKLGYKNVLIVTDKISAGEDIHRSKEINDALSQKAGINKPVTIEIEDPSTNGEIDFYKLETFLRPPYRADIIIVLHSILVYPLMTFFRKKKLRIPQDVAMISMEEGAGFDLMFSPITCLRKPLSIMAIKVVNMIWSEVKNAGKGKYKRQVNILPELIIRNSCGTI